MAPIAGHFGGVLAPVPALPPDFRPDIDAMAAAVTEKTRVIIVNSLNNPTGCIYSQATLVRLAELVNRVNAKRERPLFLVSDEPHRFLAYDGVGRAARVDPFPYTLVLGSFSKNPPDGGRARRLHRRESRNARCGAADECGDYDEPHAVS